MERINEVPNIEIKFGGPALADEVYNDNEEIRIVINNLIDEVTKLRKAMIYMADELDWIDTAEKMVHLDRINQILNPNKE